MKLLINAGRVHAGPGIERLIETRLAALAARQAIDEAIVELAEDAGASPRYHVALLLRIPGPDLHASAVDHTLRQAVQGALDRIERQLAVRHGRRQARRRSRLQQSSAARLGRAW